MLKFILLCLVFGFSANLFAGGYHFEVRIESFDNSNEDPHSFKVVLKPTAEKSRWPEEKCQKLVVTGVFDAKHWQHYKRPMSLATHQAAIEYFSNAIGKTILFGVIGKGLAETQNCHFQSKGLFIGTNDRQHIVYSVYEHI
jgi:hypothetical protein